MEELKFFPLKKNSNTKYFFKKPPLTSENRKQVFYLSSSSPASKKNIIQCLYNLPKKSISKKEFRSRKVSKKQKQNNSSDRKRYVNRKKNIETHKAFTQELSTIIGRGIELTKSRNSKIRNMGEIEKKFQKLGEHWEQITKGIENYKFEEQQSKCYKKDLQQMWMRADK